MADQGNRTTTPAVDDARLAEQERVLQDMKNAPKRVYDDLRRQVGRVPETGGGDRSDQ